MTALNDAAAPSAVSRFFNAADGLRLHAREWTPPAGEMSAATPVLCLPGLARTAADFDRLASRLAQRRRVVALDYRGRGLSDWDQDWKNYSLAVEGADILTVLAAMGIAEAAIMGTSRGGFHAMLLGSLQPTLPRAVVLNDIGPVIEAEGLRRIRGYVGKLATPKSWDEAAEIAKRVMKAQFTGLSDADFEVYARLTFDEKNGVFSSRYDQNVGKPLEEINFAEPLPTMWPQFEALKDSPVLTLRGENSDLLSAATVAEMGRRHPGFESHIVPGQGHAPLLLDAPSIERVAQFIEKYA